MNDRSRRRSLLLFFVALSLVVCSGLSSARADCASRPPAELLPADGECPAWLRSGPVLTATSIPELTEIIDGAAYLYAAHGFVAACFLNYAGPIGELPTEMTVSIFNQGTPENAAALYQDEQSGYGDPVTDWPGSGAARIQPGLGAITLQFHEACFYVTIGTWAGGEAGIPAARCLGEHIVAVIDLAAPAGESSWGALKQAYGTSH